MLKNIKRVKLYVKNTPLAHEVEQMVKEELVNNNFEINNQEYDLVISIGGDGTFIKMIHDNNFDNNVYYAGINAGSLGFLTSIDKSQIHKFINDLKNNNFKIRKSTLLETKIYANNQVFDIESLNELTIRKKDFSSLRCDILINDILLNKYIGDGLVISTTIGSTGYNIALGGSIIDNDIKAFAITPIVPINNQVYKSLVNSLILNSKKKVTIVLNNQMNLCLLSDGKIINLNDTEKIECYLSKIDIECILPLDHNNIQNIKSKIIDGGE